MIRRRFSLVAAILLLFAVSATATSNYQYGPDEYVTVAAGISPDGKYAITAHGGGELGYDGFHLFLTDAIGGKPVAPLKEVVETLDTGADAFAAKWSQDSHEVMIVYRVDRHAPLKAVAYRIVSGRAQLVKGPFDAKGDELLRYWQAHSSESKPSPKIFGTSLEHK